MLKRRPLPEGLSLAGKTLSSENLVFSPRMVFMEPGDPSRRSYSRWRTGLHKSGGAPPSRYFESWDVAVFAKSRVFFFTLGHCKARSGSTQVSFARAETLDPSGAQRISQMGMEGPIESKGGLELSAEAASSTNGQRAAFSTKRTRFKLTAYEGGKGTVFLCPWRSQGKILSRSGESSWEGKLEGSIESGEWDLITPQLPLAPRRWVCYASARSPRWFTGQFASEDFEEGTRSIVECSRAPTLLMRSWGTAHPVAWARIAGTFVFKDHALSSSCEPPLFLSGAWVKMGRLGVLGPPVPKTFFALHFSEEAVARVGLPGRRIQFNALPRAFLSSSYLRFPLWEARLLSRNLVATVSVDASNSDLYQQEMPDPEEAGVFMSRFPFASIEVALEARSKGLWKHVATATAVNAVVEFGGREPLPYLALLPKEHALGME
ncbi:MAG: hypothetical protein C4318_08955 [Acidimicrobiia bacterium]